MGDRVELRPIIERPIEPLWFVEARAIKAAFHHFKGSITHAAKALGVSRSTMYRKAIEHGLVPKKGK
jgi:transcriptional regulator of acetoin/glycerol metabolism